MSHLAAGTPSDALFAVSFMNDWTQEHIAGYLPRSSRGRGPVPSGPGLGIEVDEGMLGSPLDDVQGLTRVGLSTRACVAATQKDCTRS